VQKSLLENSNLENAIVRLTDAVERLSEKLPVIDGLMDENETIASRKQELANRQHLANRQRVLRTAKKSSHK
tara:strand:- start:101 stop:316 length:216 start_codon:yes stop_codon:yes gene_type:complete